MGKGWTPRLPRHAGPTYVALADVLAAAIAKGELRAGVRLPPQRELAEQLDIDVTTVSRAMALAQSRGLVVARGRAGSFVAPARAPQVQREMVDLSVNYPPPLPRELQADVRAVMRTAASTADAGDLFDYPRRGWQAHAARASSWFEAIRHPVDASRIVLAGGAQQALIGITAVLCEPGDAIISSGLTYPGMMTIAKRMGVRVVGVDFDDLGVLPEAVAEACARVRAKYVYLVPTFDNPTTATANAKRRAELARVIDEAGLALVEDDGHALLLDKPIAPVSAHIPHRGYYVSSLSKSVTPGLRTAYIAAPSALQAQRVSASLISLGQFPAPIAVEVSSRLIETGKALELTAAMRAAARSRWSVAQPILPQLKFGVSPTNHFGWLELPNRWRADAFVERCREFGVQVTASNAFAVQSRYATNAVRVCIGGPANTDSLDSALRVVAQVLDEDVSVLRPPY